MSASVTASLMQRLAQTILDTTNIYLTREAEAYGDGSVPGWLRVGPSQFPTIERGGKYVNLKLGKYVMKHSIKNTGRRVRCLRPVEDKITTLLIHDAYNDSSTNLEGCVAPGLLKKPPPGMGILRSAQAMEKLWELLGGWGAGKTVTLHVLSNVPGESRTRETWDRLK